MLCGRSPPDGRVVVCYKLSEKLKLLTGLSSPSAKRYTEFHRAAYFLCLGSKAFDYLDNVLGQAERLLKYAAETGIHIDPETRDSILHARTARSNGWNEGTAANVLSALAALAAQVKPVTFESLQCCQEQTFWVLLRYATAAVILALVIGTVSVATFLASALSSAIRTDIATGNELAVKLRVQLGPPPALVQASPSPAGASSKPSPTNSTVSASAPPAGLNLSDVITELQQFASTIRSIDARALQLRLLVRRVPHLLPDPFAHIRKISSEMSNKFELPHELPNLAEAASSRIEVYQQVRYFAQNILDEVSFFYGAITACVLPVMYALLGACAYLLRTAKLHIRHRTYIPHYANFARLIIAGIGGAVVGLFNNFSITQVASISPLAIAFLVGYSVDVFYGSLDGLLQGFIKNTPAPPSPPWDEKKPQ